MIITRTPFRISLFGGGTDYPDFYREHGGAVLAGSINRYCYLSVRHLPPFFDHTYRVVYSNSELTSSVADIVHPSVRECLRLMDIEHGLEIVHTGDLPARSGLGSSSSFTVGLLLALNAHKGRMVSKMELAEQAIRVEQDMIGENVGSQDQTLAAFGGLNIARFNGTKGDHIRVTPLCISRERIQELESHLMLFFTGLVRNASDIAQEQVRKIPRLTPELSAMRDMVDEGAAIINGSGDIREFGRLLDCSWKIKRGLTDQISTARIDEIYELARREGALGGKLLGAGGGGFLLLFARPQDHKRIAESIGILRVPFSFEFCGAQFVLYEAPSVE